MINIVTPSRYKISKKLIQSRVKSYLSGYIMDENYTINIIFMGRRKMKEIASTYKHEDVALPVLAFPYKEGKENDNLIGEIFLCYPQAVLLASERRKRVDEMVISLIEHGINNLFKES